MILMASSTGTDGTPAAAQGSGVGSFRSFRFRKERCTVRLRRSRMSMLPDHANSPECHVGRYRFTSHPNCDRGEFLTCRLRECTESLESNST